MRGCIATITRVCTGSVAISGMGAYVDTVGKGKTLLGGKIMSRGSKKEKNKVEFGSDYIAICDDEGEIVRWVKDEWVENPDVVFSIANGVKLAVEGKNLRKLLFKN